MTATLARYRLRPVCWGWLAVFAAGWFVLVGMLATGRVEPGEPAVAISRFRLAAFLLGLGGAVLAAPETDPPREVLRAAPVPWWRALVLRLAGWLVLGALVVLALAVRLDGTAGWTATDLALAALPNFLLVTATSLLAARTTSALTGGAVAIAAVVAVDVAGRAWAEFPLQLRAVPGSPHWQASRAWMVAISLLLVALAVLGEGRAGTGLGGPRRRGAPAPSGQAPTARVRP